MTSMDPQHRYPVSAPDRVMTWQWVLRALTVPRPSPDGELLAPVFEKARSSEWAFEDIALATYHWGDSGPHVLLVHGWESRSAHWHRWIEALLEAGYQVTSMDLPAHGHSGGRSTTVVQAGRAVLHIGSQLGPLHSVIGHSMGSAASLYAFAHGLRVATSVHIAGPASLVGVIERAASLAGLSIQALACLKVAFEREAQATLDSMELDELRRGLDHPALLLHDPQDKEIPIADAHALLARWNAASLCEVQGVGHRRILASDSAIEPAVRFLRSIG